MDEDLLHGVSFASGGSGYDDFTAKVTVSIKYVAWLQLRFIYGYILAIVFILRSYIKYGQIAMLKVTQSIYKLTHMKSSKLVY